MTIHYEEEGFQWLAECVCGEQFRAADLTAAVTWLEGHELVNDTMHFGRVICKGTGGASPGAD